VTDILVIFEFDDCSAESANHTRNGVVWQFACDDVGLITFCQNQKLSGNKPALGQVHFPGYELNLISLMTTKIVDFCPNLDGTTQICPCDDNGICGTFSNLLLFP
jgi:hypothetical protein